MGINPAMNALITASLINQISDDDDDDICPKCGKDEDIEIKCLHCGHIYTEEEFFGDEKGDDGEELPSNHRGMATHNIIFIVILVVIIMVWIIYSLWQ